MAIDRADITDKNGRHIPAIRQKLHTPEERLSAATSRRAGPRNGRELAKKLDELSTKVRRIPPPGSTANNPDAFYEAKSEIARELQKLAEWAQGSA